VAGVEVSVDDGKTWTPAQLDPPDLGRWAWRRFTFEWTPDTPGRYVLCSRASDEAGNVQPDEPAWNVGGYANNAVQRIDVTVTASASLPGE
jgi:hypothetical protein